MSDDKKNEGVNEIVMGSKAVDGEFIPPHRSREELYYSNLVAITASLYDLRLDFGRRTIHPGVPADADVTVMMSPQHAKELLVILVKTLAAYEARHGKIPADYEVSATVRPKGQEEPKPFPPQKIDDLN